jgi:hypothetical protein
MHAILPLVLTALSWAHALADTPAPPSYPLLEYRPALADYVPYRETGLKDWRAVNDAVERLGGHMGHARMPVGDHHHGHGGRDASDRPTPGIQAGERP